MWLKSNKENRIEAQIFHLQTLVSHLLILTFKGMSREEMSNEIEDLRLAFHNDCLLSKPKNPDFFREAEVAHNALLDHVRKTLLLD